MTTCRRGTTRRHHLRGGRRRPTSAQRFLLRGYSLPLVLVMLALLAVGVATLISTARSATDVSTAMLNQRRTFYACDGLGRIIVRSAQNYMLSTDTPADAPMRDFICAEGGSAPGCGGAGSLPDFAPTGFQVTNFAVTTVGNTLHDVEVPNGPFQGMNSRQDTIELTVEAERTGTQYRCYQKQTLALAKIAMFQFFVFSDLPETEWSPNPQQTVQGRTHANGLLCLANRNTASTFELETVTSANQVRLNDGTGGCPNNQNGPDEIYIGDPDTPGSFLPWPIAAQNGCANCDGSFQAWVQWAPSTFGNNLLDSAHGVRPLRLPVSGITEVQRGRDTDEQLQTNVGTSRLLVDPPRIPDDSREVLTQKLACKSDLRIINGVWYVKDVAEPADACGWPGTPIWSDHPGSFRTRDAEGVEGAPQDVGQADLAAPNSWDPVEPVRYSYYTTDVSAGTAQMVITDPKSTAVGNLLSSSFQPDNDHERPVISYGMLYMDDTGTDPLWLPGFVARDENDATAQSFCNECPAGTCPGDTGNEVPADTDGDVLNALDDTGCLADHVHTPGPVDGGGTTTIDNQAVAVPDQILNATRMGFHDRHISSGMNAGLGNILPVNFDVAAFIEALKDTRAGELGDVFASLVPPRSFNGIVYITNTWQGQMQGFDTDDAGVRWPPQGSSLVQTGSALEQVRAFEQNDDHHAANRGLPFPLCTDDLNGQPFTGSNLFEAQGCGTGNTLLGHRVDSPHGTPNAVRIINAKTYDPGAVLDNGLTIATNLPMYVLGDVNTYSDTSPGGTPWKPFLFAADSIVSLSQGWKDDREGWAKYDNFGALPDAGWPEYGEDNCFFIRKATPTTQNFAALHGWAATTAAENGGGVENAMKYLEDWETVNHTYTGSMVIGWYPVFRNPPHDKHIVGPKDASLYRRPPSRTWTFDTHFDTFANQPPGAPIFDVAAVQSWERF